MDTVLLILLAVNVGVSIQGFQKPAFLEQYKFHVGRIQQGEKIRFISSAFLHADLSHLLFNMLTLYFFAPLVISYFGAFSFLVLYFVSLLLGNYGSYILHKNQYHYSAVGASGAVTGILYAAIVLQPSMPIYLFFIPVGIPAWLFGIGYLCYSIYGMQKSLGNIGHAAHLGGAIAGYLLCLLLSPTLFFRNPLQVMVLALPIIALLWMYKTGKIR